MKYVLVAVLVLVAVSAMCVGSNNPNNNNTENNNDNIAVSLPDMTIAELWFKGCTALVTADELDKATPWVSTSVQMFTGFYGKNYMNCDYYEYVDGNRNHISIGIYPGGLEKFSELIESRKSQQPGVQYSDDVIVGVKSFYHQPDTLAFVDKETGVVVWLIASGNVSIQNWPNVFAVARLIEAKL